MPRPTRRRPPGRSSGPVLFVVKLLETWRLERDDAIVLLGFEPSEAADRAYVRDLLDGRAPLIGRDARDRVACLFRIRQLLSALFRDEDVENEWLRENHRLLDDRAPMDLLRQGSMDNMLLVLEYAEKAAGW